MEDRLGVGREEIRAREGELSKWNDWTVGARECASGLWPVGHRYHSSLGRKRKSVESLRGLRDSQSLLVHNVAGKPSYIFLAS